MENRKTGLRPNSSDPGPHKIGPDANPIRKSVRVRQVTSGETLNSFPNSFKAGVGAEEPNVLDITALRSNTMG